MRTASLLLIVVSACYAQPQAQPAYYPQQAQYAGEGQHADGAEMTQLPPAGPRQITVNGTAASERDLATIDMLEQQWGGRLPNGHYWYDNATGAAGHWGGPMLGLMPAGLGLGGPLPPNASGGGQGMLTGVFINGRELHPSDVVQLQQLVGEVPQGRWWVDAEGNFGMEGGAMMGNLYTVSQQRGGGGGGRNVFNSDRNGSVFVGRRGCVSVTGSDGSTMSTGC